MTQNSTPKIIHTDWGVANVFRDGTIELHKDLNLPEYALLKEKILNHEMDHDFKKGFWYNFKIDFFHTVGSSGLLSFMMTRPKTWIQILPLYWTKRRGFIYDKNILFFWAVIVLGIFAMIKLGGLFL